MCKKFFYTFLFLIKMTIQKIKLSRLSQNKTCPLAYDRQVFDIPAASFF